MRRVLTALALIPVVVYVVFWANFWVFLGVVITVAFLCYRPLLMLPRFAHSLSPTRFG